MRRATAIPSILAFVALVTVLTTAHAADLHAFVGVDRGGLRARAVLTDLRVADPGFVDDRFDVGVARIDGASSVTIGWRRTALAGPIGNLVLEGAVGVGGSTSGALRGGVEVAARGVAGPVALAVRAAYGQRVPFAWPERSVDPPAAAPPDPRARTGAGSDTAVAAAAATATWRIDRAWTLTVAPTVARTDAGWTPSLDAALRRSGVVDDLDVSVRVDAAVGGRARHAALGATVHHVPRRAPASHATVWVGVGADGLAPGGEVAWRVRAGASEAGVTAGWAPFWSDRPAGYAALHVGAPMADGRGRVALAWSGTTWVAELGWSRAW